MDFDERLRPRLAPLGFVPYAPGPIQGVDGQVYLRRRTFNTNRAVAAIQLPDGETLSAHVRRVKAPIGKALGYFPFFYPIGLQLVVACDDAPCQDELAALVDRIDTQTVVLQSVHAVETGSGRVTSARTWGQVITGRFIDAIEQSLAC